MENRRKPGFFMILFLFFFLQAEKLLEVHISIIIKYFQIFNTDVFLSVSSRIYYDIISLYFFHFLYGTAMFLRLFIIINSCKQQISMIILQCIYIIFFFDLRNCSFCIFIPFQLQKHRRFVCTGASPYYVSYLVPFGEGSRCCSRDP